MYFLWSRTSPTFSIEHAHYRELVRHSPKNSVCMILGLGETALLNRLRELGVQRFLMKPVTRQDIDSRGV